MPQRAAYIIKARSRKVDEVAKQLKPAETKEKDDSLWKAFFSGFLLPVRLIWRGLAWISHRPPLKQLGHGLRWFFNLRGVRFIGKILGFKYVRDSWRELRTVTWPSIPESLRLTAAVIVFAVVFGLFVTVVDYGLDKLFRQFLLK